jgi:transposase
LVAPLVTAMATIETEIRRVEERIVGLAERDPTIGLCATVPGVGLIVAATFVSVIDEAKRFRNAHAVEAYLGLVPSEATTGGPGKRRLGGITKQGNSRARAMLIQSAWIILRTRDKEDPIRRWGENIAKIRGKRIAVVATARKLAGVLWAMMRDGCVYDRASHAEEAARASKHRVQSETARAQALQRSAKKLRAAVTGGSKTREVSRA